MFIEPVLPERGRAYNAASVTRPRKTARDRASARMTIARSPVSRYDPPDIFNGRNRKPMTSDIAATAREQARLLSAALPYMQRYENKTVVVKYGGHAM
ncbi:MAG: hypothetical protein ABJ354_22270, partial [Nitratireductor sp.]